MSPYELFGNVALGCTKMSWQWPFTDIFLILLEVAAAAAATAAAAAEAAAPATAAAAVAALVAAEVVVVVVRLPGREGPLVLRFVTDRRSMESSESDPISVKFSQICT